LRRAHRRQRGIGGGHGGTQPARAPCTVAWYAHPAGKTVAYLVVWARARGRAVPGEPVQSPDADELCDRRLECAASREAGGESCAGGRGRAAFVTGESGVGCALKAASRAAGT